MKTKIISAIIISSLLATSPISALAAGSGVPGQNFINSWDENEDGKVTLAEIQEKRSSIFLSFDSDDNGILDADEYIYFDEARANDMADKNVGQTNKKAGSPMTLEANDIDGDGQVSREEFLENAKSFFEQKDANGDGAITTDDFGNSYN